MPFVLFPRPLIGARVLVVESRSFLRRFLAAVLEDAGAEVESVSGVVEAMAVLRVAPPGVVVCGTEVGGLVRFLRAAPAAAPGIEGRTVLVGAAGPALAAQARHSACPVLGLPFTLDDLVELVRQRHPDLG